MARDRGGGQRDAQNLRKREEKSERDHEGHPPAVSGGSGAQDSGAHGGESEAAARLRVYITARRVRIDPERKRAQYLQRLERLISELDEVIADPKGVEEIQLKAMDILIRTVRMCYHIVRDVDVESLEWEYERLKEEDKKAREDQGAAELGYDVEPEEPTG